MATINGVEVIGDKTAHDFDLLDKNDGINLANGVERNREATEDNHEDIVLHRTDMDVHVTPEWKNSLVSKETLGLYWTAAQTADIINEISIAGGAKLVKVDELPETGKEQTIYLVPKQDPLERDIFDEFVWIDGKFEFIGTTKADLSGYFPITGGALTGNIIERNTDNDHLGISGSYWGHGAYLWLSGQNSGYAGAWYLSARDTEKSCDLVGSPAGVLSWGGKLVATEDDLASKADKSDLNNYLSLSGGSMTGSAISRNTDDSVLQLRGGATYTTGSYLTLCGKDYSSPGVFTITARDGTNSCTLRGIPSGILTWGNKNIDVIEEQGDGYIRYSNGLQICWGEVGGIDFNNSIMGTNIDFSYPKGFISTPAVTAVARGGNHLFILKLSVDAFTTHCAVISKIDDAQTVTGRGFFYTAIGKWK